MTSVGVDAHLEVQLLSKGHGGRASSTPGHAWKCRLKLGSKFFDAMLVNESHEPFEPGTDARANVTFLRRDLLPRAGGQPLRVELWELSKVGVGLLVYDKKLASAANRA